MKRRPLFLIVCLTLIASILVILPVSAQDARAAPRQSDSRPLTDPTRPVTEIARTVFTLQYFTREPWETRVEVREGDVPRTAWIPADGPKSPSSPVKIHSGAAGTRTYHVVTIAGLKPGRRYFYRIYDPGVKPTAREASWGAQSPWRREFAVSTLAPPGRKTIIRLPVKVLLMPNVVNVASAHGASGVIAPPPVKMTPEELERIRKEYAVTSRFFFVNSGMRYWVDFQIQIDDRWQRWGDEPANADAFYKDWPVSRAYAGQDFRAPGGGAFNIVDTKDPLRTNTRPVYEERPFAAQIEQAFARRWNPQTKKWDFYTSGGGTLGVDGFPQGVPGRSQYLGGSDTAWLAAHEFHHQMESQGRFSFADREDERIVFNHPATRRRVTRPDGTVDEVIWNTAGRHGGHWNVLAFWDRTLTDAQWLRIYLGETVTVADRDEDGLPDDDPRLPLDEKRFGSSTRTARTDGRMNDLAKAMLSTWAPANLQYTFNKPPMQSIVPHAANPDNDGDGLFDDVDPYPLYPYAPFVWPLRAAIDGDAAEWANVPASGAATEGGITTTFKQAHDEAGYYGLVTLSGPWKRAHLMLEGEGQGVFSGSVETIEIINDENLTVRKPAYAQGVARRRGNVTEFEFSLPNRGAGKWFWQGGGREIGADIEVTAQDNKIYSLYEPYDLFYARMLETAGREPLPPGAPKELSRDQADKVLLPGDPALKFSGKGWLLVGYPNGQRNGTLGYEGEDEAVVYVDGLSAREFDLWMQFEAKQDAILGAFLPGTKEMGAGSDYIAFVGGYANTLTRLRLFGREAGDDTMKLTPGKHTMQLSRRGGAIWCLFDGKPILHAADPDPAKIIDRLGVIGGYNGNQAIHEIRIRTTP